MKRHGWAMQPNINKENVPQQHVTLPQTFPCQKDGSRPCKRKPETNTAAMVRVHCQAGPSQQQTPCHLYQQRRNFCQQCKAAAAMPCRPLMSAGKGRTPG